MTLRKSAIAASVKNASRGKAAFVFASSIENLPKTADDLTAKLANTKYSQFGCTACGTSMHSRADTVPFCVTCGAGDGHVHHVKSDAKPDVTAKTELVAINCDVCSASTIVEAGVAKAITSATKSGPTPIHCSCCGNPMVVTAETEAPAMSDTPFKTPDAPSVEAGLEDEESEDSADGEEGLDDDIDLDNLGALDDLDDLDSDGNDEDGAELDENGQEEVTGDNTLLTPGAPVPNEEFAAAEPEDDLDSLELEPFAFEQAPMQEMEQPMAVAELEEELPPAETQVLFANEEAGDPLVDALDMDDTSMALAFVKANGRLVAMKGHVAVATLSPKSKSPNASLIDSMALQAAAKHSVASEGLRKGLQSVGFSLVKVPVTSKATVERRVQEITAKTAAVDAGKQKVFAQAFALAAAGLNRGQWKGVENPLRAAMETELARAGVEQPRRVVAAVFEASGLAYAEVLLSTSNRLVKMSASARQELSEVLNMTSSVSAEPESEIIESRFATGGKPSTAAVVRPRINASAESVTAASSILSGSAPLSFSF